MAVDNYNLSYLIDSSFQVENIAGKPAVGGHIEVYLAGTNTKYITYQSFDGTKNPFKIPLKSDGRAVILADVSNSYDYYVYDSYGNLIFSRLNVRPATIGDVNISGGHTVITNTDGTIDVTLSGSLTGDNQYTLNTKNVALGLESPLYWKEDSESGAVIAIDDSDITAIRADISALSANKADASALSAYALSADVYNKHETDILLKTKQDKFTPAELSAISSISGKQDQLTDEQLSAIAAVSGMQPALKPEQLSAISSVSAKQDKLTDAQLSAIAAVSSKQDALTTEQIYNIDHAITTTAGLVTETQLNSGLSGKENIISYGYDVGKITTINGSGIAAEAIEYSAGANINITDKVISGKDWSTEISAGVSGKLDTSAFGDVSGTFLTAHQSLDGLMSADKLQLAGDFITGYNGTAFSAGNTYSAGTNINITNNIISGKDWTGDISAKLDTTAFSDVSGTFLTAHQSLEGYATENFVTDITDNKLDTTAFSTVSGTFLTAAGDMSASKLEYNGDKITGYNGSAFSAGSNYSAGANIDITDNVISGKDWSNEIESATSGKLDTTAFSDVSGTFLTAHQSLDGLMSADKLEYHGSQITGYNGSAFAGGEYPTKDFVAGEGISFTETTDEVTINVTGKEDTITYGYNDDKIVSINGSALSAGASYSAGKNIEISGNTINLSDHLIINPSGTSNVGININSSGTGLTYLHSTEISYGNIKFTNGYNYIENNSSGYGYFHIGGLSGDIADMLILSDSSDGTSASYNNFFLNVNKNDGLKISAAKNQDIVLTNTNGTYKLSDIGNKQDTLTFTYVEV